MALAVDGSQSAGRRVARAGGGRASRVPELVGAEAAPGETVPRPAKQAGHTASRTACMSVVQAVMTITASCSGKITQNCPNAPSPRVGRCRDIQNW